MPIDLSRHVVFHRLLNFKKFQKAAGQPQGVTVKLAVAGIYDLIELLHEEALYLPRQSSSSEVGILHGNASVYYREEQMTRQITAGLAAANSLVQNRAGGVFRTKFAAKAKDIAERFTSFIPEDCRLYYNKEYSLF